MIDVAGGVHEGVLVVAGLEHEQQQRKLPGVVQGGPAAAKVAGVVLQPGADPPGCDGAALELQEVGVPVSPV